MGKKLFLALSFMLLALSVKGQNPNLDGVWVLKNVELFRYTEAGDSVKVDNGELPKSNFFSGVFDTITFINDSCVANIDDHIIQSNYLIKGDVIELNLAAVPFQYVVVAKNTESMVLGRKYYYGIDSKVYMFYVKLVYKK